MSRMYLLLLVMSLGTADGMIDYVLLSIYSYFIFQLNNNITC